ncbi:MAG TPA: amidase family protein, partial [Sphingomonas sp.]|nr:amidase family protein [Sphingomonas sp.]
MTDITDLGVRELRDGVRAGTFSAREVADSFIVAVSKAKQLNAFLVETPDHAIAAAKEADAARAAGETLKPLAGVPIGMKDLFCTQGVETTAASGILKGFVPQYESTVSGNLWNAGAGMLGKLNLDQFAMGSSNETSAFGNVISPWRRPGDTAP